ncbi:helix-turn-helix domain containing protein [Micromonospora carbonacea]|uniref:helix-turn-helix domain containing protein n=1 Tax=Micromonospora carbonacea TaxID=47853 RepID=UPI00114C8C5F|nr:helix-turn-helix domain containing protein [Micromonospora carbonacea]
MTAASRPDCIAPKANLTGYKIHRCRCAGCTEANRVYVNRRNRLKVYGRWQPMVEAEPVRQHIRTLGAAGIGWMRAADLAGVSRGCVNRLLYGSTSRPPCKRVRRETAAAILAVRATTDNLAPGQIVDAAGTRRRAQALAALGWSLSEQARRLGRTVGNYSQVLTASTVQLRTAWSVRDLYDELSTVTPPPGPTATRTRRWAQRKGFAPPLAWDDDTIDDPSVRPDLGGPDGDVIDEVAVQRALAGERVTLTPAERDHAFRVGLARGLAVHAIGKRLHLSGDTARRIACCITTQAA